MLLSLKHLCTVRPKVCNDFIHEVNMVIKNYLDKLIFAFASILLKKKTTKNIFIDIYNFSSVLKLKVNYPTQFQYHGLKSSLKLTNAQKSLFINMVCWKGNICQEVFLFNRVGTINQEKTVKCEKDQS